MGEISFPVSSSSSVRRETNCTFREKSKVAIAVKVSNVLKGKWKGRGTANRNSVLDKPSRNPCRQGDRFLRASGLLRVPPWRLFQWKGKNSSGHPEKVFGQVLIHQLSHIRLASHEINDKTKTYQHGVL